MTIATEQEISGAGYAITATSASDTSAMIYPGCSAQSPTYAEPLAVFPREL